MKLSKTMREHLRSIELVYSGPNVRCLRPAIYGNLRTHEALLRRGLIVEASDGMTSLTVAGRRALNPNAL